MSVIKGNHGGLGGSGAPGGALGSFYTHDIERSLRFDDASNPYLYRTPSSQGNLTTFTFSCWVKRCNLGSYHELFHEYPGSGERSQILFMNNDTLKVELEAANTNHFLTNRLFRDVSSWYNIVVAYNSGDGTQSNRVKIYVNGIDESDTANGGGGFSTANYPNQSATSGFNTTGQHEISTYDGSDYHIDGYLTEVNFIDGTALTAASFGETKDGIWIPKDTSGLTFGTNGFRLEFKQTGTGTASTSTIGADTSGQTNHWTSSGLAANDVVPDTPTKNWATMNPLMVGGANTQVHASAAYAEGNLKVACGGFSTSTIGGGFSTIAIPKDKKIYCEVYEPNQAGNLWGAGVIIQNHVQASNQLGGNGTIAYYNRSVFLNGTENDYGSSSGIGGLGVAKLAAGDVLGIAVDGATGKVWFHRNGTYFGAPVGHQSGHGSTGNPSAGSNEIGTVTNTIAINPSGEIFIYLTGNGSVDDLFVNFGQDSTFSGNKSAGSETDANGEGLFQYAVPTDYVCLHSGNMSDPAIGPAQSSQSDDHFNTVLYTGNGSDGRSITGVGFDPDFVWIKSRNLTTSNLLNDTVRGANKSLFTDGLTAETANNGGGYLSAFVTDGFSVTSGGSGDDAVNDGSDTYVAWNWKGGGSASTNTDGSGIDSSVSANTDAGFSVLTYTGTGNTSHTIGHGLGKTPAFVMSKSRDTGSGAFSYWFIKWNGLTSNNNLLLNFTGAQTNIAVNYAGGGWSDFDSSNTTTIVPRIGYTGSSVDSVNKSGEDYVAWVFAQVEGFSAIGSFIGNGDDNGIFVYTGFRPAWVMIKRVDAANDWHIMDDHRNPINVMDGLLFANLTNGETSDAAYNRDFLSNGFKIRGSEAYVNASGGTFVYMAFAHSPFKFANAF
jgi:hypothetical protein